MRTLLMIAAALALSACAPNPPVPLEAAKPARASGMYAYATLAEPGTVEFELSPLYTRNALLRLTAARRLEDGRVDVATARGIQSLADQARSLIDRARREEPRTRAALAAQAGALQDEAAHKLEATR